jgi:hypothetical protein
MFRNAYMYGATVDKVPMRHCSRLGLALLTGGAFVGLQAVPAGAWMASSTSVGFDSVNIGTDGPTKSVTITNTDSSAQATNLSIEGPAAHDYLASTDCPDMLAAGASCHVAITFSPTALGDRPATFFYGYASMTIDGHGEDGYSLVTDNGIASESGAAPRLQTYQGPFNAPIVGAAFTRTGRGLWSLAGDGGIFSAGDAVFYGSTGGQHLNQPVVGIAATPTGGGYWLVAADGGIFSYGDAVFYGSTGGQHLNQPIVGMAPTPDGGGYWLVAADGGVFSYGDAVFYGSTGSIHLNSPITGMAVTPSGHGYWFVASDGGIFSYGDAVFKGGLGGKPLAAPVVGMAASPIGLGYWLVQADGNVRTYGDAPGLASQGATVWPHRVVAIPESSFPPS